jgi:hypothetical protein
VSRRLFPLLLVLVSMATFTPRVVRAQDEAALPDTSEVPPDQRFIALPTFAGEFTPGQGFDILKTKRGSINLSVYGLFRYLNQTPEDQTFTDHLGRERKVAARNDVNWHRTMVWVSGFFYDPRFIYTITVWSLASTEQTLGFGLLRYVVGEGLTFGAGIGPSLTARSMQGSWPFWAGSDRQMAEEFYRGGFASSFFVTGRPLPRFQYTGAINRSLSQLGITAANDNRSYAYSGSLMWMPTTGEFGPRGGLGDLEHHESFATRFGVSTCRARENRYAPTDDSPRHAQIKLSDGVNPFETGALADSVTVESLVYQNLAIDAGFKYRGFSFQAEYGVRRLSDFEADGVVPHDEIIDHGVFAQAMHMVVPRKLGLYATVGRVFDEFERDPWEISGGASFYPYGSRSLRLNLHYIRIDKSPTGSSFGYYTSGQTGDTISMGVDILL